MKERKKTNILKKIVGKGQYLHHFWQQESIVFPLNKALKNMSLPSIELRLSFNLGKKKPSHRVITPSVG